jgi:hypothetical protein
MGIEEVVFLLPEISRTAVIVTLVHPLRHDASIEAFDRTVVGHEIVTTVLANPTEARRITGFSGDRQLQGEEKGGGEGYPGFHVSVGSRGSLQAGSQVCEFWRM